MAWRLLVAVCLWVATGLASAQHLPEQDEALVAARVAALRARLPVAHPRLLLTTADIDGLRTFIHDAPANSAVGRLWQRIRVDALNEALPNEPQRIPRKLDADAARLWRDAYTTANDTGFKAWRLALTWQVTGDARYGREAARWLMALAGWDVNGGIDIRNNDEAFIQSLRPMIFAYDWAYDALTPEERASIEAAIAKRLDILWPRLTGKFSLTRATPPDNSLSHPMRFISTLGQGGVALWRELPGADRYAAWAYEYYARQFPVWGGDDGGWAEGMDYWSTGMTQHLRFLEAMQLLGVDDALARPFFRNNGYFGAYNLPLGQSSSFGDLTNVLSPNPNRRLLIEKFGLIEHDPALLAYADAIGGNYPDKFSYYEFSAIDSLLHLYRRQGARMNAGSLSGLPIARAFRDIGWVAMHSALGSQDDVMLALKSSPYGSASHSFADQNAFVLSAFGQPLAISSGYREWYGSPHHVGWTRTTASKNAILIDGQGQPIMDASAKGHISRFYGGDRFAFATGDALDAYRAAATQALRHVLFVDRRYFVMFDELTARQAARFDWLLHARERMQVDDANASIASAKGDARLQVQFAWPAPSALSFSQTDEFAVPLDAAYRNRMAKEWHVRATTRSAATSQDFVTLLYPYRDGKGARLTSLPATHGHVLRVETSTASDMILLGGEQARVAASRVAPASLAGLAGYSSRREGATYLALVEATRWQQGDAVVEASEPVTLEARVTQGAMHMRLQAHRPVRLTLRVRDWMGHVPAVNVSDGFRAAYDAATDTLVLDLAETSTGDAITITSP
ncbi:DUF4962 domain-containing protein [Uliginosibacterium sp. sgz301328]|uniref:DUF4962 domain-containing protein n=1 Tax=Uliginosibacterium sp. sgz301328 TaxID=3243764 RepID=UPI00359DC5F5